MMAGMTVAMLDAWILGVYGGEEGWGWFLWGLVRGCFGGRVERVRGMGEVMGWRVKVRSMKDFVYILLLL